MRALIVDLWNGEGYSDSSVELRNFKEVEHIQSYVLDRVLELSGGIRNLMTNYGNREIDDKIESALIVQNDKIIYLLDGNAGSVQYHILGEHESFVGVALYPDVNEYEIIKGKEEWEELEKIDDEDITDRGIVLLFDYDEL